MQGNQSKTLRKRAATPHYISPNQLTLVGFETPFEQQLTSKNRWVKMAISIPWDKIVPHYDKLFSSKEGRPPISGRVILGAMIIKHIETLSDRATILHIQENMFMQYFLGYTSFTNEAPFSDTLFVEIRKRLSLELLSKINEVIALHCLQEPEENDDKTSPTNTPETLDPIASQDSMPTALANDDTGNKADENSDSTLKIQQDKLTSYNKGKLIMDATVAPQNITYPTDLKLLNAARIKSEELIDILYNPLLHGGTKPRTYRTIARKAFLNTAKRSRKHVKKSISPMAGSYDF